MHIKYLTLNYLSPHICCKQQLYQNCKSNTQTFNKHYINDARHKTPQKMYQEKLSYNNICRHKKVCHRIYILQYALIKLLLSIMPFIVQE